MEAHQKYKAVIFDLFGTLVKGIPKEKYDRHLSEMADALGVTTEDFRRLWTVNTFEARATGVFANLEANMGQIYQLLGRTEDVSRITEAAKIRRDFTQQQLSPQPYAVETLTALRSTGCSTGLISNCSSEVPLTLLWYAAPLASLVDHPIFSCQVGYTKPDERIYRLCCERLGMPPQECLYIDDLIPYLAGAARIGMHGVLARLPGEDVSSEEGWQGPVISALKDVLKL